MIELDDDDAVPVPTAFTAATVNVYDVPYVRPVNDKDVAPEEAVWVVVAGDETML